MVIPLIMRVLLSKEMLVKRMEPNARRIVKMGRGILTSKDQQNTIRGG